MNLNDKKLRYGRVIGVSTIVQHDRQWRARGTALEYDSASLCTAAKDVTDHCM